MQSMENLSLYEGDEADEEESLDTYFECPPPSAAELEEVYRYPLNVCEAYLAHCLDRSQPIEPTEKGLHEFAKEFLKAESEALQTLFDSRPGDL